jgi:hypothetical protein
MRSIYLMFISLIAVTFISQSVAEDVKPETREKREA